MDHTATSTDAGAARWAALLTVLALSGLLAAANTTPAKPHHKRQKHARCAGRRANVIGTGRRDVLHGTRGRDVIYAGGGNDRILGHGNGDLICAGPGNDLVVGGDGLDRLRGQRGRDRLIGGRGADRISGGRGRDRLLGGRDGDVLVGDGGADLLLGGLGDDRLDGGGGAGDVAIGGNGTDRVHGGAGDHDVVRGDLGGDLLDGGPGSHDIASFVAATPEARDTVRPSLRADLRTGKAQGDGSDRLRRVEDLVGSAFRDVLIGDRHSNRLDGGPGNDELWGVGVYDRDEAYGGSGIDDCSAERVQGCESGPPWWQRPFPSIVELTQRLDGSATLVVVGDRSNERIAISRADGAWRVDNSAGIGETNCIRESAEAAHCPGAARLSALVVATLEGDDNVTIARNAGGAPAFLDGGAGDDRLAAAGADDLLEAGYEGNDRLYGGGGSDGLFASSAGTDDGDVLFGGRGPDLLISNGACGGHVLRGGGDEDNASFARAGGYAAVHARIGGIAYALDWPAGVRCAPIRVTKSIESLEGSPGDDVLIGNNRRNTLMGQQGHDVLLGRGGADHLLARDGERDLRIDCGLGPRHLEHAQRDGVDPRPRRC